MLRTSLRKYHNPNTTRAKTFLSSNAQDFIEDGSLRHIAVAAGHS